MSKITECSNKSESGLENYIVLQKVCHDLIVISCYLVLPISPDPMAK
jgi:hypothetical protein